HLGAGGADCFHVRHFNNRGAGAAHHIMVCGARTSDRKRWCMGAGFCWIDLRLCSVCAQWAVGNRLPRHYPRILPVQRLAHFRPQIAIYSQHTRSSAQVGLFTSVHAHWLRNLCPSSFVPPTSIDCTFRLITGGCCGCCCSVSATSCLEMPVSS